MSACVLTSDDRNADTRRSKKIPRSLDILRAYPSRVLKMGQADTRHESISLHQSTPSTHSSLPTPRMVILVLHHSTSGHIGGLI